MENCRNIEFTASKFSVSLYSILRRSSVTFPSSSVLPTVALSRNAAAPRPLPTPSFAGGLQPMTSNSNRRISRTDMDFEQALRSEGTVKLAESVDVNSLGADSSPAQQSADFVSSTPPVKEKRTPRGPRPQTQPGTPVIVPPTPSQTAGSSSTKQPVPSPSSSSAEIFYDAEDSDIQTKRRSLYRSPGTSSSPDLATLLRKAKERGGTVGAHHKKLEKRQAPPPPLPTGGLQQSSTSTGNRPRSSTSSATFSPVAASSSSMHTVRGKEAGGLQLSTSGNNDDWASTNSRSRKQSKDGGDKVRTLQY
jgi:PH/SEC7 domain-containing protein